MMSPIPIPKLSSSPSKEDSSPLLKSKAKMTSSTVEINNDSLIGLSESRKEYYGNAPPPMAVQKQNQSFEISRNDSPFVSRVNLQQSQQNTPYSKLQKSIEVEDRFMTPIRVNKAQ